MRVAAVDDGSDDTADSATTASASPPGTRLGDPLPTSSRLYPAQLGLISGVSATRKSYVRTV